MMIATCCRRFVLGLHQNTFTRLASHYIRPKAKRGPSGQAWLALAGVTTTLTGVGIYLLGRPEEEIEGMASPEPEKYANENVVKAYLLRSRDKIVDFRKTFSDPSREKLLPDLLPPEYQRPYTLVLELNDVLIHTEYERGVGWKYQKRPGVDALLVKLFNFYEIVLFTSENAMTGSNIANALDPEQLIMYKLFRDSTQYVKGHHIKDLSKLNRPITKVIMVDTDPNSIKYQPENSIILDKWTGDIHDRTLWELIPLLQTIAVHQVDDVRPVLDSYKENGEKKVLETFKTRQAQLRAEQERLRLEHQRMGQHGGMGGGQISTFRFGRFGASGGSPPGDTQPLVTSPPTPQETQTVSSSNIMDSNSQSWTEWIGTWIGWK